MPNVSNVHVYGLDESIRAAKYPKAVELNGLTADLTNGIRACFTCATGTGHDNALKGIIVQFDLTISQNAWQQLQRYHFIDFVSSQSKMHKITKFSIKKQCNRYVDDRIIDIVQNMVDEYNRLAALDGDSKERKAAMDELYLHILYSLPCGFELTARMTTNYQQLKTIYQQRRHHRLPDWQYVCDWIKTLPRFMELTQKGYKPNED